MGKHIGEDMQFSGKGYKAIACCGGGLGEYGVGETIVRIFVDILGLSK